VEKHEATAQRTTRLVAKTDARVVKTSGSIRIVVIYRSHSMFPRIRLAILCVFSMSASAQAETVTKFASSRVYEIAQAAESTYTFRACWRKKPTPVSVRIHETKSLGSSLGVVHKR
jgi:hypothetical protein